MDYKLTDIEAQFLEKYYLQSKYHLSKEVKQTIDSVSERLALDFGKKFVAICVVGGLVNGSYILRKLKLESKPKTFLGKIFGSNKVATDVDFYLIVDNADSNEIVKMANLVSYYFSKIDIVTDGTLNGKNEDNLLDISKIDFYVKNGLSDMLSLPFKYCIGHRIEECKKQVKQKIKSSSNHKSIWQEVVFYHDSTLGLYHGSFDSDFTNYVQENWLPKKLQKYGLK